MSSPKNRDAANRGTTDGRATDATSKSAALVAKLQSGEQLTRGGKPLSAEFLSGMIDLAQRYAAAEKLVSGGTQVTYSPASLDVKLDLQGDVVAQGEQLANAERTRHELPDGPILEIAALLEDQGIKIIARRFPDTATSLGAFFFDGEIGPAILLNAGVGKADTSYALARHYGHFLADYEPYPHLVSGRPDPQAFSDPSEVRAHTFALAFLMPQTDLDTYRKGMGLEQHEVLHSEFLQQLQIYFEVDVEMVIWRLLGLGWVSATQLQEFLEQQPEIAQELHQQPARQDVTDILPDRFVQLVARAFGDDKLNLKEAGQLLGVSNAETTHLLGQFHYDDSPKPTPPTPTDEQIH
jgi:Zn-dependent peptidase ImmA (M78 family)